MYSLKIEDCGLEQKTQEDVTRKDWSIAKDLKMVSWFLGLVKTKTWVEGYFK